VRRREFELWIHRDGNAAALVAIEVELPADRSRPDAGTSALPVRRGRCGCPARGYAKPSSVAELKSRRGSC
jgi:hypothetical protein